ncbi:adenylyltransferase/cytidyltransferase family protein, partial [Escherichia coli]|nr:adenylyltransferase/cytidyltransferase family protein [Escherichia coli]
MKAVGIVTEYNPFHNGHIYHIQQAKKETGADVVVAVMSGNFV